MIFADEYTPFHWLTSLRREAQQVCLIFHTTAATRSSDRKQLEWKRGNNISKMTTAVTKKVPACTLCWWVSVYYIVRISMFTFISSSSALCRYTQHDLGRVRDHMSFILDMRLALTNWYSNLVYFHWFVFIYSNNYNTTGWIKVDLDTQSFPISSKEDQTGELIWRGGTFISEQAEYFGRLLQLITQK